MSSKAVTGLFQAHKRLRATETMLVGIDTSFNMKSVGCLGSESSTKAVLANMKKDEGNRTSDFKEDSSQHVKLPRKQEASNELNLRIEQEENKMRKSPARKGLSGSQPSIVFKESRIECAEQIQLQYSPVDPLGQEIGEPFPSSQEDADALVKKITQADLSQEQRMRMEMNRAVARARRNLRLCEDRVTEARAKGHSFPMLADLLVEQTWLDALQGELQKPYMERLPQYVRQEAAGRVPIYPPPAKVFNAFNTCPFDKIKVVIIGQDPYHGPGQAMGLCFSVERGIKLPSSLINIFKEIYSDLGCVIPAHGNLEKWAYQGVLLLNTVLTVREHHANSHAKKGWEPFTDAAIRAISQQRSGVVFLLWGNSAQEKIRLINPKAHHILKSAHPSGLSAHKGFFNCRHFSQANQILRNQGLLPVDWQI